MHLIGRFYDASAGHVYLNGADITQWPREQLRKHVAIVMQKPQLFAGTIRSNLLWGNPDASEAQLWEALHLAQAADFVQAKTDGLDEVVEQGGRNLSGGQKQRLTIARALVAKPDILILDDSASALDYATDAALRQALASLTGKMTVFIVSQRTSSIAKADHILVLDDGHLVDQGTPPAITEALFGLSGNLCQPVSERRGSHMKWTTLKRVMTYLRPYWKDMVGSLFFALLTVIAALIVPIYCGNAIDEMIGQGQVHWEGILRIILAIGIVTAIAALSQWIMAICNNHMTFCVSRDLRERAMNEIQALPLSYLDQHPSGDIVSRLIADVDVFADGLLMGFTQLFSGVLTIIGTLGIMLSLNWVITLVVVILTPLSFFTASFIASRTYRYFMNRPSCAANRHP